MQEKTVKFYEIKLNEEEAQALASDLCLLTRKKVRDVYVRQVENLEDKQFDIKVEPTTEVDSEVKNTKL